MSYTTITGKDKFTFSTKPVKTVNSALITIDEKDALPVGQSYVNLAQGAAIYADTLPIPTSDTMSRRGWYYQNTAGTGTRAMNFYYMNGASEILTVADIKGQYAILTMDDISTYYSGCMLAYYTKPTPADITAGLWYHSRLTYGLEPGTGAKIFKEHLAPGERIMVYWGTVDLSLEPTIRRVPLIKLSQIGENASTEELLTMTINSPSQAAADKVKMLVESAGFEAHKGTPGNEFSQIVRRLNFEVISSGGTGGGVQQVQSNNLNLATEGTLTTMSSKLDTGIPIKGLDLTTSSSQPIFMSSGNLFVRDGQLISALSTLNSQLVSQWSVQNNGSFQLLETVPAISGGVRLAGDTTGNAFVVVKNSSLDTHIMGSHDGSTWNHILTTPQGKMLVNSSTQDGVGNEITSTSSGTIRGLDVNIINSGVNSLIRANDYTTSAPITLTAINSALRVNTDNQTIAVKAQPISIYTMADNLLVSSNGAFGNTADTQGFLYLGIMLTITNFVGSGHSVYSQVSPDGINWGDSNSAYVSGNGTFFIQFYQPSAFRYLRLRADMSFNTATYTCSAILSSR